MDARDESFRIGTRQQTYRHGNDDYRARETKRSSSRHKSTVERMSTKPFVGWDSEGDNRDGSIFLFGNSEGDRIAHPALSTVEMLNLLLECEARIPDAIHVIFGGEYDFNMFLRDLPLRCLLSLRDTGGTRWNGYKISHVPRKWFTVSRDGISVKVFDIQLFFACSYVKAITDHGIGTDDERNRIIDGKAQRSVFGYENLDYIEPYWRTELRLLPLLADRLRESFYRAGMYITSWHGPGALARNILNNRGIKEWMKSSPEPVHDAARFAFCGGRFESFKAGLYPGTMYSADINSAYPYAATFLPALSHGEWVYDNVVDRSRIVDTEFALYHIRYRVPHSEGFAAVREPKPLFHRHHDDRVTWDSHVTGWYWSPEAALVAADPRAEFIESWTYDEGNRAIRPFAFLAEYYDIRARLKAAGDPMQLSFKLGPNSVYGQLAQRTGWERTGTAPKFHQIEWAGFITSMCRAMVYKAAMDAWRNDALISIDTDGVYSTRPFSSGLLETGSGLGEWKLDTLPGVLYWQSGVMYIPDENGEWRLNKSRGAPKGSIPFSAAKTALLDGSPIEYNRTEFIGYRRALRQTMGDWRYFKTEQRSIEFGGSEWSKRNHNVRACRLCKGIAQRDGLHDLYPNSASITSFQDHSKMHVLPWLDNDHVREIDALEAKAEMVEVEFDA